MKKNTLFVLALASLTVLSACGNNNSNANGSTDTSTVTSMTKEEIKEMLSSIGNDMPILTEVAKPGQKVPNVGDNKINQLLEGRALNAVKSVDYADGVLVKIEWSHNTSLANFEYSDIETSPNIKRITPDYPRYEFTQDSNGVDTSVIPPSTIGRLYAQISFGGESQRFVFDAELKAQPIVNYKNLFDVRNSTNNEIVGVRGYITAIQPDYDLIFIQDGDYGLGLYKAQAFKDAGLKVGDYVESAGSWRPYQGLNEIGWLKFINVITNPEDYGAKEPVVHSLEPQDFYDYQVALSETEKEETKIADRDGSRIKIDKPMKFKRVEVMVNKVFVDKPAAEFPTDGTSHANVYISAPVVDAEGKTIEFEFILYVSYHIGKEAQQGIKDFLVANWNKEFTYNGWLSSYNAPVLGIFTAAELAVAA